MWERLWNEGAANGGVSKSRQSATICNMLQQFAHMLPSHSCLGPHFRHWTRHFVQILCVSKTLKPPFVHPHLDFLNVSYALHGCAPWIIPIILGKPCQSSLRAVFSLTNLCPLRQTPVQAVSTGLAAKARSDLLSSKVRAILVIAVQIVIHLGWRLCRTRRQAEHGLRVRFVGGSRPPRSPKPPKSKVGEQ